MQALANKAIYTIYGRYTSLRVAFRARGWEEKPRPKFGQVLQSHDLTGLRVAQPPLAAASAAVTPTAGVTLARGEHRLQ